MALISILMDIEEGHVLSTFGLAEALKKKGHDILYVSIPDNEELVLQQGFAFYAMFSDIYPKGFRQNFKKLRSSASFDRQKEKLHMERIIDGSFDAFFSEVQPDMIIASSFLALEALLLYYRYKLRPVIYTPMLRYYKSSLQMECTDMVMNLPAPLVSKVMEFLDQQKIRFTSLEQLLQPLNEFPELICCPAEFEINPQFRDNTYYIEPTIRSGNGMGVELYMDKVKEGRKIIYASLGTQTIRYGKVTFTFFEKMLAMMQMPGFEEMHMVLCIGPDIDMAALPAIPCNVTVVRWISQIDMLNYASLVINHGGIGTVKECIYFGVPMVAFGVRHDQPHNAALIDHHKIGVVVNIEDISIAELAEKALYVLNEEEMKYNLNKMKNIFRQIEKDQPGVRVIERLLKQSIASVLTIMAQLDLPVDVVWA